MTPLDVERAETARLRIALEAARQEVEHLRADAIASRRESTETALRTTYGMPSWDAWLLATLYTNPGRAVPQWWLAESFPFARTDERPSPKIVQVVVCKVRKRLGEHAIRTVWGLGYQITETGSAAVEQALALAALQPRKAVA